MARFATANDIINRVAVEVGLPKSPDAVGDSDQSFVQLTGLLTSAGQELIEIAPWEAFSKTIEFTTTASDTGIYPLPDDWAYMTDQTGWDHTNNVPIGGPLSPQQWSYLLGRNLVSSTIYASFRLRREFLELFPSPPPAGLTVRFEYTSRDWVLLFPSEITRDTVLAGTDVVLYSPILIVKFLKVKWLEAKGLDASAARLEFDTMLQSRMGKDKGAPRLNAGRGPQGIPYLNGFSSVPDSGYGF